MGRGGGSFCICVMRPKVIHQYHVDGKRYIEMLFDPNQAALLSEICSWPQFKNLQKHLETFSKQLIEIKKAQHELDEK